MDVSSANPNCPKFPFTPLARTSYASPARDTTNWPPEQARQDQRGSDARCCPSEERSLLHNRFLRRCSERLPLAPRFCNPNRRRYPVVQACDIGLRVPTSGPG